VARGEDAHSARSGYYMHDGGHGMVPTDWDIYIEFLKMLCIRSSSLGLALAIAGAGAGVGARTTAGLETGATPN